MPYIIEKGYVTIDGASLTITEIDDKTASFGIMLISHSQTILTLTNKEVSHFRSPTPNYAYDGVGRSYCQCRSGCGRQVCTWLDREVGSHGRPDRRKATEGEGPLSSIHTSHTPMHILLVMTEIVIIIACSWPTM
jgi:hypothetical protein